jgi:NAD(P)-dependent dehydrogenase (short-subunit alcohol dehydrogenase family)
MAALNDDLLRDRVVLVSGGTSGLGAAVADAAVRNGATVVVTGRRRDVGEAYVARVRETGGTAHYVACDVADVEQVRAAVDRTVELCRPDHPRNPSRHHAGTAR